MVATLQRRRLGLHVIVMATTRTLALQLTLLTVRRLRGYRMNYLDSAERGLAHHTRTERETNKWSRFANGRSAQINRSS